MVLTCQKIAVLYVYSRERAGKREKESERKCIRVQ